MRDLIGVREKLGRLLVGAGVILRTRERVKERAGIKKQGQFSFAEKRLQFRAVRVQTVGVPIRIGRNNVQQGRSRYGQHRGANGGVILILIRGGGDDQII